MERILSRLTRALIVSMLFAAADTTAQTQTSVDAYAAKGAAIARVDRVVAAARTVEAEPLYGFGFDVATGIFGDPALGAQGNTATGPGSMRVRDSLNAAGQRGFNASVSLHLSRRYGRASGVLTANEVSDRPPLNPAYAEVQRSAPATPVGTAIDRFGTGAVIDKGNATRPSPSNRLIISAEGSHGIQPVPSGKLYQDQTTDGEIWLAISYEDGTPFKQASAADIRIETLRSAHLAGQVARLDPSLSRAADGIWHFTLPQLEPGSHFYLIKVLVDVKAWRTAFEGQAVVRASYTRMPFWNAQRVDGTIWEPPK